MSKTRKKDEYKVAASLMVYDIPAMTYAGRRCICNWLRRLAKTIQSEPEAFGKTFRSRYMYTPAKRKHA